MTPRVPGALRRIAVAIPPIARIVEERDQLRAQVRELDAQVGDLRRGSAAQAAALEETKAEAAKFRGASPWPAGHYYSPLPDLEEVAARREGLFDVRDRQLPGIDLRVDAQLALLPDFAKYYAEQPFADEPGDGLRYGLGNRMYNSSDGIVLYSFLRHLRPPRVIEVGSGWSSALTLDVNDLFLDGATKCTFIEPFPERLHSLLKSTDKDTATVIEQPLWAVDPAVFEELSAGDLLVIDSTHVSKIGSDVNQLFLEVLPALAPGVTVHIHDVFWPFEYPERWISEGRAWNEDYLLRALLIGNPHLEIVWFNNYLSRFHKEAVSEAMPLWANKGGGAIYLRTR